MADPLSSHRHYLQTDAWAEFQQALGKQVINRSGPGWHYLAVLEAPAGFGGGMHRRLYVPYGPTCLSQANLEDALQDLSMEAKKHTVTYVRVEPVVIEGSKIDMRAYGGHQKSRAYQPEVTHIVDLTKSENDLMQAMSPTNRNLWNTYNKKGLSIRKSYDTKDLPAFLEMMHVVAKRTGIIMHEDDYFQKAAHTLFTDRHAGLVFVDHNDKPIVGAMFYDNKEADVRYYAYAGSHDEARKLQANSPLVTYLMMDAKNAGFKLFDLYGVAPVGDDTHKWSGISKFKRSFGGYDHEYLGTWEIPVNRLKYALAKLSRRIKS